MALVGATTPATAHADRRASRAVAAVTWCGSGETPDDRPDTVGGNQIHVVYAYPSDAPNRFAEWAPQIVDNLRAVDTWWRSQDPTRTPRFDLASFAGCSGLDALDISSVRLPNPASAYEEATSVPIEAVPDGKKALVYYDAPVKNQFCGYSSYSGVAVVYLQPPFLPGSGQCLLGPFGSVTGWPPRTAVHEIVHTLTEGFPHGAQPHSCPGDAPHICDSGAELLWPGTAEVSSLAESVLDVNHDDYFDSLRASPFLAHTDTPTFPVSITMKTNEGVVTSDVPGLHCPRSCTAVYERGAKVALQARVADGFQFRRFEGCQENNGERCVVTVDKPVSVVARFVPLRDLHLRVEGPGHINGVDIGTCARRCTSEHAEGASVVVRARPKQGARLVRWGGLCDDDRDRCEAIIGRSNTITAEFTDRPLNPFELPRDSSRD
jgi:hypothetical protein